MSEPKRSGKRSRKTSNPQFEQTMLRARDDLWASWDEAGVFEHKGSRGHRREEAVRHFLSERLPGAMRVATGHAADRFGTMTRQLDLMIYDASVNGTLIDGDIALLPAEALLAVVEVKSVVTAREVRAGLANAASVQQLRPFGVEFAPPRERGAPAVGKEPRCFYTLLARNSDLVESTWLGHEWARLADCDDDGARHLVDTLVVLDRGMIRPAMQRGIAVSDPSDLLQQWFVDLSNFLARESARRSPVDWQMYVGKRKGWVALP